MSSSAGRMSRSTSTAVAAVTGAMRGDRFLPDRQLGVEEEEEADDDDDDEEEEAKVVRRRRAARCCDASLEARLRSVRSTSSVAILEPDEAKAEAMSKDSASESGGAGLVILLLLLLLLWWCGSPSSAAAAPAPPPKARAT